MPFITTSVPAVECMARWALAALTIKQTEKPSLLMRWLKTRGYGHPTQIWNTQMDNPKYLPMNQIRE